MRHLATQVLAALALPLALSAQAAPVVVSSVSTTGIVNSGTVAVVNDNVFPADYAAWNGPDTLSWTSQAGSATTSGVFFVNLTFDQAYTLTDATYTLDNNDSYWMQYSLDGSNWTTFIRAEAYEGDVIAGMDTFSTLASHPEYEPDQWTATSPVVAKQVRVFARAGDNFYSVGELQFNGVAVVPEPASIAMALAGLGIAGFMLRRRG